MNKVLKAALDFINYSPFLFSRQYHSSIYSYRYTIYVGVGYADPIQFFL